MPLDPQRFSKLAIKATPTLHYNNLTVGGGNLCFTHGNEVHLVAETAVSKGGSADSTQAGIKDSTHIYQVKFVTVAGTTYLVLGTASGFQIWDNLGVNIVFNFNLPGGGKVQGQESRPPFVRGVTTVKTSSGAELVCVGSCAGPIYCFELSGLSFRHTATVTEHVEPITDLCSELSGKQGESTSTNNKLVSTDESGKVIIWDANSSSQLTRSNVIEGDGEPCVATVVRGNRLVCAYASGLLRFFDLNTTTKWMEICAHSRYLSALAIHPTRDLIATSSEDTTINVWTLPEVGQKAEVVLSAIWADSMICGVVFSGDGVAACAYDTNEIRFWS